jgi:hypothetical protein
MFAGKKVMGPPKNGGQLGDVFFIYAQGDRLDSRSYIKLLKEAGVIASKKLTVGYLTLRLLLKDSEGGVIAPKKLTVG